MPWFTKERKKKASLGFSGHIQGRFRPISVVSGVFRPFLACFSRIGRRLIWPDMADTAQLWLNQPGSARIEADSAQIELRWCESSRVGMNPRKKKKKTQTRIDAWATASDAASRIGRGCGTSDAASVLSRSPPVPGAIMGYFDTSKGHMRLHQSHPDSSIKHLQIDSKYV